MPLYVYKPSDTNNEVGKIVKVWAGLGKELFGLHKFEVQFPEDADLLNKARLIGAMFLVNELFFRADNEDAPAS